MKRERYERSCIRKGRCDSFGKFNQVQERTKEHRQTPRGKVEGDASRRRVSPSRSPLLDMVRVYPNTVVCHSNAIGKG
jgi:hypothetical protein